MRRTTFILKGGARHDFWAIPPTAVGGCFKLDLPKKRGPVCQSHAQQWVDRSSTAYRSAPPIRSQMPPRQRVDRSRQDMNDPPTAVGGIAQKHSAVGVTLPRRNDNGQLLGDRRW